MTLTRRSFARSLFAAPLVAGAGGAIATQAHAESALTRVAFPSAQLDIGRFKVTVLTDGYIDMPFGYFTGQAPEVVAEKAKAAFADKGDGLRLAFNQYLIEEEGRRVLVDTGPAGVFGPTTGHLAPALEAMGVTPDSIDAVILTHTHVDHISGMVADGQPVYRNAEVYVDRRDLAYFNDPAKRSSAPEYLLSSFDATAALVAAYPNVQATEGDTRLANGLEIVDLTGHTPGHVGLRVADAGKNLVIASDMMFHPVVHPESPSHGFVFEQDPAAAEAMRTKFFAQAAGDGSLIANTHMPFPGVGRIASDEGKLRWVNADWAHSE